MRLGLALRRALAPQPAPRDSRLRPVHAIREVQPLRLAQVLMCAHHSALFRFEDGHCIEGPCAGASLDALKVEVDVNAWVVLMR